MSADRRRFMQLLPTDAETSREEARQADKRTHTVRAHKGPFVRFWSVVRCFPTEPRSKAVVLLACLLGGIVLGSAGSGAASVAPASALPAACPATPTLLSRHVAQPPLVDGVVEGAWSQAEPLAVPLTWGRHAAEEALVVQLRSLYTDQAIYFLAQWPDPQPATEPGVMRNRLTLHFDLPAPSPDAADHMCLVACHTAFADAAGRLAYLSAETIPPGRTRPLPAGGGWDGGAWQLEWSRPLRADNGYDLQLDDLQQAYAFFVKVFQWQEGRADPVSADCQLIFQP